MGHRRHGAAERRNAQSPGQPVQRRASGDFGEWCFVAFFSIASNLVPNDANGNLADIFIRDRHLNQTTLVSVNAVGEQHNGDIGSPRVAISAHGRCGLLSNASNLVAGDTNGRYDVFVHDRRTGENTRASVDLAGRQGNGTSDVMGLSASGRFVLFFSTPTIWCRETPTSGPTCSSRPPERKDRNGECRHRWHPGRQR